MLSIRIKTVLSIVLGILLIPFIAMQFSDEVNWSGFDFIVAFGLLFGAGMLINYSLQKLRTRKSKIIACIAIIAVLILVWAELAVGIFGSPVAGS